ncbi:hypothetical protein Tco_1309470 [Tanacetum coccineum]
MMRKYRAQLDAERATKLAHGRNHSKTTPKSSSTRPRKDLKKRSSKKRKAFDLALEKTESFLEIESLEEFENNLEG